VTTARPEPCAIAGDTCTAHARAALCLHACELGACLAGCDDLTDRELRRAGAGLHANTTNHQTAPTGAEEYR
jgi:hypothetical protein